MNDYSFGNYIYRMRKKSGDSQNELGGKLGVTGKAVSKWENGTSDPSTSNLIAIAKLFNLSAEDLLQEVQ